MVSVWFTDWKFTQPIRDTYCLYKTPLLHLQLKLICLLKNIDCNNLMLFNIIVPAKGLSVTLYTDLWSHPYVPNM